MADEVQITPTIIGVSKEIIRNCYKAVEDAQESTNADAHDLILGNTLAHAALFLNLCRASGLDANEMLTVAAQVHGANPPTSFAVH